MIDSIEIIRIEILTLKITSGIVWCVLFFLRNKVTVLAKRRHANSISGKENTTCC